REVHVPEAVPREVDAPATVVFLHGEVGAAVTVVVRGRRTRARPAEPRVDRIELPEAVGRIVDGPEAGEVVLHGHVRGGVAVVIARDGARGASAVSPDGE